VLLVLPTPVLLVLPTLVLLTLLLHLIFILSSGRARRKGSTTLGRGLAGAHLKELERPTTSAKSLSFFRRPSFFGLFQSLANTMKRVVYKYAM
jgi:hypothetical protein